MIGQCGRGPTNDGLLLFYKKFQEVDTVLKLILLGVPNSIKENMIKGIVDKVPVDLEYTLYALIASTNLLRTNSKTGLNTQ